ncbi:MAG TPA: TonB family protein [Gemmatimonadaceae bacterium]|nr:TonB family protein [Gemmatimonadaceae bacterium]
MRSFDLGRMVAIAAGACVLSASASAQGTTHVSGIVTDATGAPIVEARVGVDGMAYTTATDSVGRFRITGIRSGDAVIRARRLGFTPTEASIVVPQGGLDAVSIRLRALPTLLAATPVRARAVEFTGRLAGYYERLAKGGAGQFITRERIDRENPRMLSQLLQRSPGVTASRIRGGGMGVRMRGRNCWPLVWIDGVVMPAGEVDLDAFPPSSIQGIELYLGSTTAPAKYVYLRSASSCGTILLWSRGPDTDPMTRTPRTSAFLEQLVASLSVFTADKVDEGVRLIGPEVLTVAYPPALLASRTGGTVIAEFVVGAGGRVEENTFGVVSSPHPLFTEAVREAIVRAEYVPAVRNGVPVRQLVQQPFEFSPESGRLAPAAQAAEGKAGS